MSVWADGKRFDDTLSREISHRNAARTIRGGDFSTPLRFRLNDRGHGQFFCHLGREISPLRFASVEMTRMGAAFLSFAPEGRHHIDKSLYSITKNC